MKEKENVMKERKQLSQLKGAVIRSSKKREARHYINSKYSGAGRKIRSKRKGAKEKTSG